VEAARKARSIGDLKRMIRDTPPLRSFEKALAGGFGVIAEIKRRSPSMGDMRAENVEQAPMVYAKSPIVKAISVITDFASFGMSLEALLKVKAVANQPILRKDFIRSEHDVYQARAFGADAVLLMAAVLNNRDKAKRLFELASECGMDVLFEAHTKEEIGRIPEGVRIFGINSRNFMGKWRRNSIVKTLRSFLSLPDYSTNRAAFSLIEHLPENAIKVAESGITLNKIVPDVVDLGYDAALIGTSLLKDPRGVQSAISEFEGVLMHKRTKISPVAHAVPA